MSPFLLFLNFVLIKHILIYFVKAEHLLYICMPFDEKYT